MGKISSAVLKIRNFRLLLLCRLLVSMALSSQAVIVGWQIYEMTKSPFMLGLTGLVEAIPAITCALVGARNVAQIEANAAAGAESLPSAVVARLNTVTQPLKEKLGPSLDYYEHTSLDRTQ